MGHSESSLSVAEEWVEVDESNEVNAWRAGNRRKERAGENGFGSV